jgi:cellulose synthase/poly-beta-1,6-N-acetylglucosamine synthase-like glycosyltransferase
LQAPLIAENPDENWLSAHWALEYDVQFGLLLPGLTRLKMPILLGGTSNHFRLDALHALGGWDAWNVTEDADLGLRIARAGLRCAMISLPTFEDAPTDLDVWVAQRSRWVKGFIQTWLVLMRSPRVTLRELGLRQFIAANLSLGTAILAPLLFAPCMVIVLLALASNTLAIGPIGMTLLIAALMIGLVGDLCAPGRWHLRRMVAMLTRTFYWPLHFLAAVRAIWELAKDPFFWAKTPHKPRQTESHPSCSTGLSASVSPPAS